MHLLYFVDYGVVFLFAGLVHAVVHIDACHRTVGRDGHYIELIDIPKFACFGFCRTGHTRKLVIHAEVVLQGDCGKCLCSGFHLHVLLGFYCLVQSIAPAATFHNTAGLLVYYLHLVVVGYHIVYIARKQCVGLDKLVHGVHAFALHRIVLHQLVLLLCLFLIGQRLVFHCRELACYVGEHKELGVAVARCQFFITFIGKFHAVVLFVDYEV